MVIVYFDHSFKKKVSKIRDCRFKSKLKKKINRIISNSEIGNPMRFARKGTREIYVHTFRLSYRFFKEDDKIVFLKLYHKKGQ